MRKISSAERWSCATCTLSVPSRVIVLIKNRAATYVVTPSCRAFNTILRFVLRRCISCCARLSVRFSNVPFLLRIFSSQYMKYSRQSSDSGESLYGPMRRSAEAFRQLVCIIFQPFQRLLRRRRSSLRTSVGFLRPGPRRSLCTFVGFLDTDFVCSSAETRSSLAAGAGLSSLAWNSLTLFLLPFSYANCLFCWPWSYPWSGPGRDDPSWQSNFVFWLCSTQRESSAMGAEEVSRRFSAGKSEKSNLRPGGTHSFTPAQPPKPRAPNCTRLTASASINCVFY